MALALLASVSIAALPSSFADSSGLPQVGPPGRPEQQLRQAREALAGGDTARVIEITRQALRNGESGDLRNLLGKAYALSGEADRAVPELETAIRLQPDNEVFRFDLAQFLLKRHDFASAAAALEKAQKRLPGSAQIELALGVAYYGLLRYDDTIRAFLKTIDLAPNAPQPSVACMHVWENETRLSPNSPRKRN